MSILNTVKELFKKEPLALAPTTFISEKLITEKSSKSTTENPPLQSVSGVKNVVDHPFDFELYESTYLSVPVVQGSIDKHVDWIMSGDYGVISEKESILKQYKEFVSLTDFDMLLRIAIRNTLIFGSGFIEVVWSGKTPQQLKVLDSKTMYVQRDDKGKILGYVQIFKNKVGSAPITFKTSEIIHFAFNNTGTSPYGTSIIRSLYGDGKDSTLKQYLNTNIANSELLQKQVNAKLHIKLGDKENHPTQSDIDDIKSKLEQQKNNTEWVTSYLVDMSVLGYEGKTLDLTPFINYNEDQMVGGLQTPQVLLGKGNVNEGLANVQKEGFEYRIKSIQSFIGTALENNLFDIMFGIGKYKFVWGKRIKQELEELNILIRFMAEKFVLSPETRLLIENRVRTILGAQILNKSEYDNSLNGDAERKMKIAKAMKPQKPVASKEEETDESDESVEDNNGRTV